MKDSTKESNCSKSDYIDESSNKKRSPSGPNLVKYQRLSTENSFKKKSEKFITKESFNNIFNNIIFTYYFGFVYNYY